MKFLLPDETAKQIAYHLAREIFAVGDESSSPATRIQFMLGKWPDHERAAGGLCEIALASVIHSRLRMWPATETGCNCPPERTTAHLPECPTLNRGVL
jgi:predicted membrane chloride channel (bestrophin family)